MLTHLPFSHFELTTVVAFNGVYLHAAETDFDVRCEKFHKTLAESLQHGCTNGTEPHLAEDLELLDRTMETPLPETNEHQHIQVDQNRLEVRREAASRSHQLVHQVEVLDGRAL